MSTTAALDPHALYRYSRSYTPLPCPEAVDDAAVAAFHQDGFIAVENVLTPEEVAEARAAIDDLMAGRVEGFEGLIPEPEFKEGWETLSHQEKADKVRKVWLFCAHEERLRYLAVEHPVITRLMTLLNGENVHLIQDMALLKPPHIGTEKPWHQDAAYFNWGPPEKIIGIWIALDAATAENGCMHAVPGTHREGPVSHHHLRDCQIPDEQVDVERDVMVELQPGGAMLFSALLHHGTPPNTSSLKRWALQYHYAGVSCKPLTSREHGELFFEEEHYSGCCLGRQLPLEELNSDPVTDPYRIPVARIV